MIPIAGVGTLRPLVTLERIRLEAFAPSRAPAPGTGYVSERWLEGAEIARLRASRTVA